MGARGLVHSHSSYSFDCAVPLADVAALARRRRLRFVLQTEHSNELTREAYDAYRREAARLTAPDLLVVPGIEYASADNRVHVLALGVTEFHEDLRMFPLSRGRDLLDRIHGAGGLTILAHPDRGDVLGVLPPEFLDRLDGVEVWNGKTDILGPSPAALRLLRARRRAGRPLARHRGARLAPPGGLPSRRSGDRRGAAGRGASGGAAAGERAAARLLGGLELGSRGGGPGRRVSRGRLQVGAGPRTAGPQGLARRAELKDGRRIAIFPRMAMRIAVNGLCAAVGGARTHLLRILPGFLELGAQHDFTVFVSPRGHRRLPRAGCRQRTVGGGPGQRLRHPGAPAVGELLPALPAAARALRRRAQPGQPLALSPRRARA